MSDQNIYVTGYRKNPGSQTDGLRAYAEFSLGQIPVPLLGSVTPGIVYSQGMRNSVGMTITFAAYAFAFIDHTTAGAQGSIPLITLPAKVNLITPAVVSLAFDASATFNPSGNISPSAVTVWSLGSAAAGTDNATLASTEADHMASQSVTLGSGLGSLAALGATTFAEDGTAGAKTIYLNAAMADAFSGGNSAIGLTGTIDLTWQPLN